MKNKFGGTWTESKISILETYTRQYLTVFKNQINRKLLYFDGFAGSGEIEFEDVEHNKTRTIEGAAVRILKIDKPRSFNMYYFVEKKKGLAHQLEVKPLFHFFMATNSEIGLRIANSVVNPKLGF